MRIPYSLILASTSLTVTGLATPLVIRLARRLNAFDRPGQRRIHHEPTPTLGGLAMVVAVLGIAWVARVMPGPARMLDPRPLVGITLAEALIVALGTFDDLRGARPCCTPSASAFRPSPIRSGRPSNRAC